MRAIAVYLPQYHPIPENDAWWGAGFTEWTNVSRAKPLFPGHCQPRLPTTLGYYDLRVPEVRSAQAELAREHGIDGFCYYHYWFEGRRLLERPFNEVLATGEPDFPFCLCWANESWSRRWLGEESQILIRQTYSAEDDVEHARWLCTAFADDRYIRVHGRPVFLIYRPAHLPDAQRTTDTLRNETVNCGLPEPWLVGVDAHRPGFDFRESGFDMTMAFQPQLGALPHMFDEGFSLARMRRNIGRGVWSQRLRLYDDSEARERMRRQHERTFPYSRSVYVSWDNTPRRGRDGSVIMGGSPERFGAALRRAMTETIHDFDEEQLIFINAWNEWAEGNYLEPDALHGSRYLEEVNLARAAVADQANRSILEVPAEAY